VRLAHVSLLGTLVGAGFWGLSGTAAQALFQTYQFPVIALVTIRTLVSGLILFIIVRPSMPRRPLRPLLGLSVFGFAGSQLMTALSHYLGLLFSSADKEGVKEWVNGWEK
jgi:drug/metabolite transporter (DMT)-like permease